MQSAVWARELLTACIRLRPGDPAHPSDGTKLALRSLVRRHQAFTREISELETALDQFTARANQASRGVKGVSVDGASMILVAAGDNPHRLSHEAACAALCGVSPIEAFSGKTVPYRLNRGGNRRPTKPSGG